MLVSHPCSVVHWCVEWLLWTTMVKAVGSHSGKQMYLIVSNFFLGFIGDSIVSMPCALAFRDAHIIECKVIS